MEDMFKNEIFGTLEPPHGAIIKGGFHFQLIKTYILHQNGMNCLKDTVQQEFF